MVDGFIDDIVFIFAVLEEVPHFRRVLHLDCGKLNRYIRHVLSALSPS